MQTNYHVGRGDITGWARGTTPAVRPQEMQLKRERGFTPVAHIGRLRARATQALMADAPRESVVALDLMRAKAPKDGDVADIVDASIDISNRLNAVLMGLSGRTA